MNATLDVRDERPLPAPPPPEPSPPEVPAKITAGHRARRAYVYVRQSSPHQVQHHRESQHNQYALVQRALALGWPAERVRVIDSDLGQSGRDGRRSGFRERVAEVSLGGAGLILASEPSRLARNNADWYALLDLEALRDTLIGDTDGVYDPSAYNDRLLLGLRGMLSEAELHLIQLRLAAGRRRQIERGAYRQQLPTGLVRHRAGHRPSRPASASAGGCPRSTPSSAPNCRALRPPSRSSRTASARNSGG
jgi:DNA invertase Pin-like site-specific DNA recombinase